MLAREILVALLQVMPDVMTPESMVTKLDEFESMAEDAVSQEDKDVSPPTRNCATGERPFVVIAGTASHVRTRNPSVADVAVVIVKVSSPRPLRGR